MTEQNDITEEGFKSLAKGTWKNLQFLGFTSPTLEYGQAYRISPSCLDSLVKMRIKNSKVEKKADGKTMFVMEPFCKVKGGKNIKMRFLHAC